MSVSPALRHRLLFAALAATLASAYWVSRQETAHPTQASSRHLRTPPSPRPERAAVPPVALVTPPLLKLPVREAADTKIVDLFGGTPPLPQARAVSKPEAPPLPFRYIGRYVDGGITRIFLEQENRLHTVRVGDIIDDLYRVERIDTEVRMIYLPLKEKQSLMIGETQ